MNYHNCCLCPRMCGADRDEGRLGFCGCPDRALVAKWMIHRWEEPALAPGGKSGAIFFGGCTLRCSYCQNAAISGSPVGRPMDAGQLRAVMEELIGQGVLGHFPEIPCEIYRLPVTQGQYSRSMELIDHFLECRKSYSYNYMGLLRVRLQIEKELSNKFVCSQFVAYTMEQ